MYKRDVYLLFIHRTDLLHNWAVSIAIAEMRTQFKENIRCPQQYFRNQDSDSHRGLYSST